MSRFTRRTKMTSKAYGHTITASHDDGCLNPQPGAQMVAISRRNMAKSGTRCSLLDIAWAIFASVATDLTLGGHSHRDRRFNCTDKCVAIHLEDKITNS